MIRLLFGKILFNFIGSELENLENFLEYYVYGYMLLIFLLYKVVIFFNFF